MTQFSCPRRRRAARLLRGGTVLFAGLLLLGFNAGWLPSDLKPVVFSGPAAIILLGLLFLLRRAFVPGSVLVLVGGYLLAQRLGLPVHDLRRLGLPLLLIFLGVYILARGRKDKAACQQKLQGSRDGTIDEYNLFGGSRQQYSEPLFRGGEIQCVFGGSELDLTQTSLPEGITVLEISCLFGGITLTVPSTWNVQMQTRALFGGFVEEEHPPRTVSDTGRTLLIRGSCIVGGGEIRYRDAVITPN